MPQPSAHLVRPVGNVLFRRADKVTCVSVAESELLLRRYPSMEPRLSVVPLGVEYQALVAAEPFDADRPIVLITGTSGGRQARRHGHPGIRRMRVRTHNWLSAGQVPHLPVLERLARELGVVSRV